MPVGFIDLNADLGESYGRWRLGDDAALLPLITSANVACGFHGGDPLTMRRTVAMAAELGVIIGAHVSYPDLVGFGRREMDVEPGELEADVLYQVSALDGISRVAGTSVRYVKPHGALYHRVLNDARQAEAVVSAVRKYSTGLSVMVMAGTALARGARDAGLRVIHEGFADRAYTVDGLLVPRTEPEAVHTDPSVITEQAVRLARDGIVDSICLHGDTPGAVQNAEAVRATLGAAGIEVRSFI
ncbi:MAG: LamB/YcsF family protein [Candidatus Dormibacteria bacterium]